MKPILPDFKTERTDVQPPLPAILKLVPVAFLFSLLGLGAIAAYSFHGVKNLETEAGKLTQQQNVEKGRLLALQTEEKALNDKTKEAREVQNWISGSSEVYPMILKIARTVDPDTFISDLTISRLDDNPSHIKTTMKLSSPRGSEQAEILTQAIAETLNLRPYSNSTTPSELDENEVIFDCNWAPAVSLNEER